MFKVAEYVVRGLQLKYFGGTVWGAYVTNMW